MDIHIYIYINFCLNEVWTTNLDPFMIRFLGEWTLAVPGPVASFPF